MIAVSSLTILTPNFLVAIYILHSIVLALSYSFPVITYHFPFLYIPHLTCSLLFFLSSLHPLYLPFYTLHFPVSIFYHNYFPYHLTLVIEGVELLSGLRSISFGCVVLFGVIYALNLIYPQDLKFTLKNLNLHFSSSRKC